MDKPLFGTQAQLERTIFKIQTEMARLMLKFSLLAEMNKIEDMEDDEINKTRQDIADLCSLVSDLSMQLIAPSDEEETLL